MARDDDGAYSRAMTMAHRTPADPPAPAAGTREACMLYPESFKSLERVRWSMENEVPWHAFDGSLLSDEQARTIKMTPSRSGRRYRPPRCSRANNHGDSDFPAFIPVWFYEEQKRPDSWGLGASRV